MNQRIQKLRKQSLEAINTLSAERALLVTEFYKKQETGYYSVPVKRAKCLEYILANKAICINENELIVGERGPAPKATPTYPEINLHSLDDLETLNTREKVSFLVDEDTYNSYKNIVIPYWNGITNRDKVMNAMTAEWHLAYNAGVFTEFQEQRAPGHTVAGNKIFRKGMLDLIRDIEESRSKLDFFNDPMAFDKKEELDAMEITANALISFSGRYAKALKDLAENENNTQRIEELLKMSAICKHVPAHAPRTFHEALQHYWFIHLGVITELNPWDSFNPGRLDQHLLPFYKDELEKGSMNKENVVELLESFWVKFNNHPSPPKMGVTAKESSTYTDFCLINLGGLKPDGSDAVNELSYVILDVIEEMRLLQPSSMIQVSKKNPDSFIKRAIKITKTGFGQPSIFNTDGIIQQLTSQGKNLTDARNGGASGCVETGAFGTESYILTGYFNLTKVLELTLNNGYDNRTGKQVGLKTGNPDAFVNFEQLMEAFNKQLKYFIDIKILGNNVIERIFAQNLPAPFLSLIIDDCISKGIDYNAGGARYNTSYIQGVGLGTITDSLTAIKYQVFDKKNIGLPEYKAAIQKNYNGWDDFRYDLVFNTPKYGNDNDYADELAVQVFNLFYESVNGRDTTRGGKFRINMLPTTSHVYFGSVIGATPDGRLANVPLSEGISPVQGADKKGPTAVLKSAAKIDHLKTGGTLLNQKFTPSFFKNEESIDKILYLVRAYFKMDAHHIQFNVVNADTLRKAQKEPEKYSDLIVRVAGYSDYFNDLGLDLQNEIIARTEQENL